MGNLILENFLNKTEYDTTREFPAKDLNKGFMQPMAVSYSFLEFLKDGFYKYNHDTNDTTISFLSSTAKNISDAIKQGLNGINTARLNDNVISSFRFGKIYNDNNSVTGLYGYLKTEYIDEEELTPIPYINQIYLDLNKLKIEHYYNVSNRVFLSFEDGDITYSEYVNSSSGKSIKFEKISNLFTNTEGTRTIDVNNDGNRFFTFVNNSNNPEFTPVNITNSSDFDFYEDSLYEYDLTNKIFTSAENYVSGTQYYVNHDALYDVSDGMTLSIGQMKYNFNDSQLNISYPHESDLNKANQEYILEYGSALYTTKNLNFSEGDWKTSKNAIELTIKNDTHANGMDGGDTLINSLKLISNSIGIQNKKGNDKYWIPVEKYNESSGEWGRKEAYSLNLITLSIENKYLFSEEIDSLYTVRTGKNIFKLSHEGLNDNIRQQNNVCLYFENNNNATDLKRNTLRITPFEIAMDGASKTLDYEFLNKYKYLVRIYKSDNPSVDVVFYVETNGLVDISNKINSLYNLAMEKGSLIAASGRSGTSTYISWCQIESNEIKCKYIINPLNYGTAFTAHNDDVELKLIQ